MIYIASPYSDPDPEVRHNRYKAVLRYTATLLANGDTAFSPIVHCHPMAFFYDMPTDHKFWMKYDRAMIGLSKVLYVLMLPGYEESAGIKEEVEYALELKLPVHYVEPPKECLCQSSP